MTKEEIIELCKESFDRGAESYKKNLIEGMKCALEEIPDLSGYQMLDIIEKIEI